MEPMMNIAERAFINMRINLRRANIRMAEQFLNCANIGAALKHMRGKAMTQDMRGNRLRRYTDGRRALAQNLEYSLAFRT